MRQRMEQFTRPEIRKIAEGYANTKADRGVAASFCERYRIANTGVFYKLLKKAVIESIVSNEVACQMAKKAAENAEKYGGGKAARSRTENSYHRAFELRKTFKFSDDEIRNYAMAYVRAPDDMSAEEFANLYCMTMELFEKTMIGAIIDSLIDDESAEILMSRGIESSMDSEVSKSFHDSLVALRRVNCEIRKDIKTGRRLYKAAMRTMRTGTIQSADEIMREAHRKFVMDQMKDFAISDEIQEYADSMGINLEDDDYTAGIGDTSDTLPQYESYKSDEDDVKEPVQLSIYDLFN